MSTMTVLYRGITEADIEELLSDPRSSAMSRGDQFEVRDTLQARVDQLTEQNRELLEALKNVEFEHDYLLQMDFCRQRRGKDSRGIAVDDDEVALEWQSHDRNLQKLVIARRAAIRKATGEEA